LASFEEQAPGTEKPAIGTTSYRNQMLRARQNMVTNLVGGEILISSCKISDPERDKVNPFQSLEDANRLE